MTVPVSAPSPTVLAILAGSMAGILFLLPRLGGSVPVLALPLSIAGLFSAAPLLGLRLGGRLIHALLALSTAVVLITLADSAESASGFAMLFGVWALVSGEVLERRKSIIAACSAGFLLLSLEALLAGLVAGQAPIEATLQAPNVQAAFDQWAAQAQIDPTEAKASIDEVRAAILALYPSLSVISVAVIVTLNAIALGRLVQTRAPAGFSKDELLNLRWPLALVVAFIGSGALLLVPQAQTVAWNGLVVTMFLFMLQGLSILGSAFTRIFSSGAMRSILLIACLLGPWAILVALLGLFDQWFDFRNRFVSSEPPPAPQ